MILSLNLHPSVFSHLSLSLFAVSLLPLYNKQTTFPPLLFLLPHQASHKLPLSPTPHSPLPPPPPPPYRRQTSIHNVQESRCARDDKVLNRNQHTHPVHFTAMLWVSVMHKRLVNKRYEREPEKEEHWDEILRYESIFKQPGRSKIALRRDNVDLKDCER